MLSKFKRLECQTCQIACKRFQGLTNSVSNLRPVVAGVWGHPGLEASESTRIAAAKYDHLSTSFEADDAAYYRPNLYHFADCLFGRPKLFQQFWQCHFRKS